MIALDPDTVKALDPDIVKVLDADTMVALDPNSVMTVPYKQTKCLSLFNVLKRPSSTSTSSIVCRLIFRSSMQHICSREKRKIKKHWLTAVGKFALSRYSTGKPPQNDIMDETKDCVGIGKKLIVRWSSFRRLGVDVQVLSLITLLDNWLGIKMRGWRGSIWEQRSVLLQCLWWAG